jgi:hypothetical protein
MLADIFILSINHPVYFDEGTNNSKFYPHFISWDLPTKEILSTYNRTIIFVEYNTSRNINIRRIKTKIAKLTFSIQFFQTYLQYLYIS